MKNKKVKPKAYFIGGGIASLAGAVYLVKDGKIPGKNITILERNNFIGGSLDGQNPKIKEGYSTRGYRMFEKKVYSCTLDLLSAIPSLKDPKKNLEDEFLEFNKKIKTYAKSRLITNGEKISAKPLKLNFKDRISLLKLLFHPEFLIEGLSIEEYFTPSFFETNFWLEFCTVFSFQKWHSLAEFRRYILRFIQDSSVLDSTRCIQNTPCNQYEFMVLPIISWLKKKGVKFRTNCEATNLEFGIYQNKRIINCIYCKEKKKYDDIFINKNDYVFITLGSMTKNSSIGSTREAPVKKAGSWKLWESIAKNNPDFGKPEIFNKNIDKTKWISFTITFKERRFLNLIKKITERKIGAEGPITFKNSNWLISIVLPPQPYFSDQPKNTTVCWGYGLFPNEKGNFVRKKMSDCNGTEILTEICYHLGFYKNMGAIINSATCIPCMMPYITSQFSPRKNGDRPQIIPKKSRNFAFIGQYCEIPEEISFTVEYSIRSAQIAVYKLLKLDKEVCPIYKGQRNPKILYNAIKTIFR